MQEESKQRAKFAYRVRFSAESILNQFYVQPMSIYVGGKGMNISTLTTFVSSKEVKMIAIRDFITAENNSSKFSRVKVLFTKNKYDKGNEES